MNKKKLVVIGGGAAGFFCAINAAKLQPLLEVIIIEKTGKLLSKVKVSKRRVDKKKEERRVNKVRKISIKEKESR